MKRDIETASRLNPQCTLLDNFIHLHDMWPYENRVTIIVEAFRKASIKQIIVSTCGLKTLSYLILHFRLHLRGMQSRSLLMTSLVKTRPTENQDCMGIDKNELRVLTSTNINWLQFLSISSI